eukprot:scaffold3600_cov171-Amphora_coffeaeformis.AAC.5
MPKKHGTKESTLLHSMLGMPFFPQIPGWWNERVAPINDACGVSVERRRRFWLLLPVKFVDWPRHCDGTRSHPRQWHRHSPQQIGQKEAHSERWLTRRAAIPPTTSPRPVAVPRQFWIASLPNRTFRGDAKIPCR